jgi:DNA processing protein
VERPGSVESAVTEREIRWGDPDYPGPLRFLADPPPVVYVRGALHLQREAFGGYAVAIVGARDATAYGLAVARSLAHGLARHGVVVVSGLARGIDGAAHRGALEAGGVTVAVVGGGVDVVYPQAHRALRAEILRSGLVIGEWPNGTRPLAHQFPLRNRIISGLALGVVVVEATARSGSLITARWALEQGREVFAVPGPIGSARSSGPHGLLKEGAKLVENEQDVLDELPGWVAAAPAQVAAPAGAAAELLVEIARGASTVDAMGARTGRKTEEIWADLLDLELRGLVLRGPGGRYSATAAQTFGPGR